MPGQAPGISVDRERLAIGGLYDQVVDDVMGFVDVVNGAVAQAADGGIVFLAGDVIVRLVEQFHGAVKAAGAIDASVDRGMIVQVLSIPDGSAFDFVDRFVNLFDGVLLFCIHVIGGRGAFEMSASVAKIGESMEVCGMAARFVGERKGGADSHKKYDYGAMSQGLHGFLFS
jgi:hypothetical protein